MKKLLLLCAIPITLLSQAQQKSAAANSDHTDAEKQTALLSMIGGLSAGYLLNTQELIDGVILLHESKVHPAETVRGKLGVQKAMIEVLLKQSRSLITTKALGEDASDYEFITEVVGILEQLDTESDAYLSFIKNNDPVKKKAFDTSRNAAKGRINVLLGLEE